MGLSVITAAITLLLCQSLQQPAQCNDNSTNLGTSNDRLQQNKSKRTVAFMLHNYGDHHPTGSAADALASSSSSTGGLNEFYSPVSLSTADVGSTKQVAAQQVLYEFKQTPTKAVSNVHVDQYYQPIPTSATFNNNNHNNNNNGPPQQRQEQELTRNHHQQQQQQQQPQQYGNSAGGFLTGAETIANPVQHSTLVRHGQNYAQVQFEPLTLNAPHHVQTQQYVPGKYFYVNGKIVYQPNQQQPAANNPHFYANQRNNNAQLLLAQQQQQQLHQKPLYPAPYIQPPPTQQHKFTKTVPAVADFRHFQAPHPAQYQQITRPVPAAPKRLQPQTSNEEQDEETVADEDEPEQQQQHEQNDDADEEQEQNDEQQEEDLHEETEDDDDMDKYFGSYSSFDDHHDDRYEETGEDADEDEDSDRGSTRTVPKTVHHKRHKKKHNNRPDKYSKNKSFKYAENYSSSSKYGDKPSTVLNNKRKSPKKVVRRNKQPSSQTKHYKAMKYTRQDNGRPRIETIEGRQSKNVPVIHKHKVFRENKWLVTKSTD